MKLNNRYVLAAVTLLIAGIVIYTFREIVSYVLIAWVVSMVGAPLVKFLRKYLGKNIAAGLTLAVAVLEEQPQSATDHIRTQIVDMDSLLASQGGSRDSVPRQNITLLIQIDDRDSEATLRSSQVY